MEERVGSVADVIDGHVVAGVAVRVLSIAVAAPLSLGAEAAS